MIWDPDKTPPGHGVGVDLTSRMIDQIASLCGSDLHQAPEKIEDLAWAIDRYLSMEGQSTPVTSRYLTMLTSRALASIGEDRAARKLFIFGLGMAAPSEWTVSRGESMLILDLNRMTLRGDACLEIVFFSSLNMALEAIADFWDEVRGRGILGLRHICSVAAVLLGESHSAAQRENLTREIMDACREKMDQVRRTRGWEAVPDVMSVEL
jgi:hypothetical protein